MQRNAVVALHASTDVTAVYAHRIFSVDLCYFLISRCRRASYFRFPFKCVAWKDHRKVKTLFTV
jgi:hypothetical protein